MNQWYIRKTAIVEADDFYDSPMRNGLNFLFHWKTKYPKFKITLFTIPDRTSNEMIQLLSNHTDWIELAVHGWDHESNFECYSWDYDKTKTLMEKVEKVEWCPRDCTNMSAYSKIFKAPGWCITPGNNGYPANPEDALAKDPQAVYKALNSMDYLIVDRHYNALGRPKDTKVVCIDCNPDIVHMHTWNMMSPNKDERNGFEQVEERGLPWDKDTEFYFISEAWEKDLIKPCI